MNLRFGSFAIAAVFAIASFSTSARAQSFRTGSANVPFDFDCSGSHFKAGIVSLSRLQERLTPTYKLTSQGNVGIAMARAEWTQQLSERSRLIFLKQGNRYTLVEAWQEGSNFHLVFPLSKKQQTAMKERTEASLDKYIELPMSALSTEEESR